MSLERDYTLATSSPALLRRAQAACVRLAYSILSEEKSTASHSERVKWAKQVLTSGGSLVKNLMWALALDSVINKAGEGCSDEDIMRVVSENVNKEGISLV